MSGEYIVGSTDADFLTIQEALSQLRGSEIGGDVTFLLQAETFDESFDLSSLALEDYRLTIRGTDREETIIQSSSGGTLFEFWAGDFNGIIGMDESSNISLENFTISGSSVDVAMYFANSSDISVEGINFQGTNDQSIYLARDAYTVVRNCEFSALAEQSVFMNQGDSVYIQSSKFSNYTRSAIFRFSTDFFFVQDNEMSSELNDRDDIDMSTISDREGYVLSGNTIDGSILAVAGTEIFILNNVIKSEDRAALTVSNSSREGSISIYNNVLSSESNLGVILSMIAFEHTDFINNTVINGGNPSSLYNFFYSENVLSDRIETFDLTLANNIFKGQSTSAVNYAVFKGEGSELYIDHNLLFSDTDELIFNQFFSVDGTSLDFGAYTLAEWQSAFDNSFDQAAQSFTPEFLSEDNFRISSAIDYRFGAYYEAYSTDIDGDPRTEAGVDVGADQFVCDELASSFDVYVFDEFIWEGTLYDESGSYPSSYVTAAGCDSTATLNLTILKSSFPTDVVIEENSEENLLEVPAFEGVNFGLGEVKDESLFALEDGFLRFISPPDFEDPLDANEDNVYLLDIVATDEQGNVSTLEILVFVMDLDEIAPEITSDTFILVDENITLSFYTITANEAATFTLGLEKDEAWFIIEESELRFFSPPDFEVPFDGPEGDNDYFIDVIATDPAGNESSTELIISVVDLDDVILGTALEGSFAVYPNPVVDYLHVESEFAEVLEIFDQQGRRVRTVALTDRAIDVSDLAPNTYSIHLRGASGEVIEHLRLIKK